MLFLKGICSFIFIVLHMVLNSKEAMYDSRFLNRITFEVLILNKSFDSNRSKLQIFCLYVKRLFPIKNIFLMIYCVLLLHI